MCARSKDGCDDMISIMISDIVCESTANVGAIVTAYAKAGKIPPPGWTEPAEAIESVFSPTDKTLGEKSKLNLHLKRSSLLT